MKIYVGIPAYDHKLHAWTAMSLAAEAKLADLKIGIVPGCALITSARNKIAKDFLLSDCDRLVMVDADVSWNPGDLLKIASHKEHCVAGAYRFKKPEEEYPVNLAGDGVQDNGLLAALIAPTGFMSFSKESFYLYTKCRGDRRYDQGAEELYCYFENPYTGGRLWGEDSDWCNWFHRAGGTVWVDPTIKLGHHEGSHSFMGDYSAWFNREKKEGML